MAARPFVFLASQSPRRRQILRTMRISFRVISSAYVEEHDEKASPARLVERHARGKARGAAPVPEGLVLGADTLVYGGGRVLGKPKNMREAFRMVHLLQGRAHAVYSGVALRDAATGQMKSGWMKTRVYVKKMTPSEIRNYLRRIGPLDKAGAYAIQKKPYIVERIEGSYTNVVGLPEELVRRLMRSFRRRA